MSLWVVGHQGVAGSPSSSPSIMACGFRRLYIFWIISKYSASESTLLDSESTNLIDGASPFLMTGSKSSMVTFSNFSPGSVYSFRPLIVARSFVARLKVETTRPDFPDLAMSVSLEAGKEGVSNSVGGLSDGSPARLVKSGGTNLIEKENRRGETISHRRQ